MNYKIEPSSFRDKDATVFYYNDKVYRIIYNTYKSNFDSFIHSGLFDELIIKKKIITHSEVDLNQFGNLPFNFSSIYKIIEIEKIPLITYPYEWSFEQLKQAALLTLEIQKKALDNNLTLKDASAYNVQFLGNKPIFIDTTSFEAYQDGKPWEAYRQFCMHFMAPLLLYYYKIPNAIKLLQLDINGISLKFASKILPIKSHFNLSALIHIHWHAIAENNNKQKVPGSLKSVKVSKQKLINIIDHLFDSINNLKVISKTEWTNYYQTFSYTDISFNLKKSIVEKWLSNLNSETIVDAGCNEGEFSILASKYASKVISFDFDESVIQKLFLKIQNDNLTNIYPIVVDLSSPSPSIGWNNNERLAFVERLEKNNTTLALALIHHLAIGNNVPFNKQASFFAAFSNNLIIEYVPKNDIQVKKLLVSRKDIYEDYNLENFINSFSEFFVLKNKVELENSERILIHFYRK